MSIRRGPSPADHFAQIANSALRDERLSWKSRGLLAYLLSHNEGWETSVDRLVKAGPDGRDAVRSGLAELTALGYLTRSDERNRTPEGHLLGYEYTVSQFPVDEPAEDAPAEAPPAENQPTLDNPTLYKKTISKNTISKEDQPQERPARGSRLAPDWQPSEASRAKVAAVAPHVDHEAETEVFRDYWVAQPGQKGVKVDWDATWRNWMRRKESDWAASRTGKPTRTQQNLDTVALYAQHEQKAVR